MTDTTLTPVAGPEAPPDAPPPQQAPEQPAPAPAAEVDHTPGGWPVVPLAVTGTNTTATLLGAAALVGGPAALAVAATGAVVVGTAAAARTRRGQRGTARAARTNTARTAVGAAPGVRGARRGGTGRVPLQKRPTSLSKRNGAGHGTSTAGARGKAAHRAAGSGQAGSLPRARAASASAGTRPGRAGGRMAQARAVREAARASAPTRAARRAETTGARRAVADARRAAKHRARTASLAGKGPVGRTAAKALGATSAARRKAVDRARAARDRAAARHLDGQREAVRTAPARKRARKALWRSAARFQGRRLLAALLAGALGLIGLVTTPLGRRLGWAWLMYPGRRLYARLTRTAAEQRAARDAAIRERQAEETAAEADDSEQIGDTAERPAGTVPAAPSTTTSEGENMSGFRFEEAAAEMEAAAQSYEPENAMEILAMVEGLPAALTSVANVMRILAERADGEFPLEKEVADGFNDMFGALMSAVAVAEDMGPLFRQVHEQDIARHEDPRNGPQAEKGWNV
ncbi:hypothetical protein V1L54_18580 [Streptomyces sp. TRM 70361]|uniref:hypothetical protein n=1 Tax=Streptomyces sp. TRM 70361 TaxID=3116553 RepID=UPI002E7BF7E3|nr:hypothetical protein [Streptomyces sp. TRM 70361]MEE1941388.1 hypothetical protein [Streptomyces sp. TRM 70361]